MIRPLVLTLAFSVLLTGCSSTSEAPKEIFIQLRRTGCYGICPTYTVEVDSDGTVNFDGSTHVRLPGVHSGQIAPSAVGDLAIEALDLGFMELTQEQVDDCPEYWTDNPTAYLTIRVDGRENSIEHYEGCRGHEVHEMLGRLEDRIDEVLQTSKWVEAADSVPIAEGLEPPTVDLRTLAVAFRNGLSGSRIRTGGTPQ